MNSRAPLLLGVEDVDWCNEEVVGDSWPIAVSWSADERAPLLIGCAVLSPSVLVLLLGVVDSCGCGSSGGGVLVVLDREL